MIIKIQSTDSERLGKEQSYRGKHVSLWEGKIEQIMQVDWGQVRIGAGGSRWGIGKAEEIRKRQLDLGDIWVAACTSRMGHFLESSRITLMKTPSNSSNSLN